MSLITLDPKARESTYDKLKNVQLSDCNVTDITFRKKNIHNFIWQYRLVSSKSTFQIQLFYTKKISNTNCPIYSTG